MSAKPIPVSSQKLENVGAVASGLWHQHQANGGPKLPARIRAGLTVQRERKTGVNSPSGCARGPRLGMNFIPWGTALQGTRGTLTNKPRCSIRANARVTACADSQFSDEANLPKDSTQRVSKVAGPFATVSLGPQLAGYGRATTGQLAQVREKGP